METLQRRLAADDDEEDQEEEAPEEQPSTAGRPEGGRRVQWAPKLEQVRVTLSHIPAIDGLRVLAVGWVVAGNSLYGMGTSIGPARLLALFEGRRRDDTLLTLLVNSDLAHEALLVTSGFLNERCAAYRVDPRNFSRVEGFRDYLKRRAVHCLPFILFALVLDATLAALAALRATGLVWPEGGVAQWASLVMQRSVFGDTTAAALSGVYPVLPQWLLLVQGVLSMLLPWSTLALTRLPATAQCGVVLAVAAAAVAVQVQLSTPVRLPLPFHPALAVATTDSAAAAASLDAAAVHAAPLMPLLAGVARVLATRCGSFLFGWVLGSLCRTTPLQAGLRRSQLLRVAAGLPLLFALRYLTLLQVYNTDPDSQGTYLNKAFNVDDGVLVALRPYWFGWAMACVVLLSLSKTATGVVTRLALGVPAPAVHVAHGALVLGPVVGRWGYAMWGEGLLGESLVLHVAATGAVLVCVTRWFLEHVQKPVERVFSRRPARLSFN